jgi:cobalamin biosynthesis protein CobD/CbiB
MLTLLMFAGATGVVGATTALWVQGRRMIDRRIFAGLVAVVVTVILFSLIAWAAAAISAVAPLSMTWAFVGTLALLFALRLYRELCSLPAIDSP